MDLLGGSTTRVDVNNILWEGEGAGADALSITILFSASLSLLGSAFIIVTFLGFPALRNRTSRIILFLSLSNFFSALSYFFGLDEKACVAYAAFMHFFDLAGFCWTACFATVLFGMVVLKKSYKKFDYLYHAISWGVPSLSLLVVWWHGCLGEAGLWCWISPGRCEKFRWWTYYSILFVVFIYCMVAYVSTGVVVHREFREKMKIVHNTENTKDLLRKEWSVNTRLSIYVLAFVVIRVWGIAHRLNSLVVGSGTVYVVRYMHALCSPLQGFVNALIYGFNKNTYRTLRDWCVRVLPCCKWQRLKLESLASQVYEVQIPVGDRRRTDTFDEGNGVEEGNYEYRELKQESQLHNVVN